MSGGSALSFANFRPARIESSAQTIHKMKVKPMRSYDVANALL
jgi:hypothetical protein